LEELRMALKKSGIFFKGFEDSLKALTQCDQCARVAFLEQIKITGEALLTIH